MKGCLTAAFFYKEGLVTDDNIKGRAFTLYLIRHGESVSNIDFFGGNEMLAKSRHDPQLSPNGERQALLLGKRFADVPLDAVFSSGFERALQTAFAVSSLSKGSAPGEIEILNLLTETDESGEGITKTLEELAVKYGAKAAEGTRVPPLILPNVGFTEKMQYERAEKVFDYFTSRFHNGEYIAAVSHACFITFLVLYALGIKPKNKDFRINFYNTGVTKLIFYKGGTSEKGERLKIDYINDAWHLKADGCKYLRGK